MSKKKKLKKSDENALLKAQLTRALADYDNLQKRVERDSLELGSRVRAQFLIDLLPAIDMLYNVQKHLNDPGLALSIQQFENTIQDQGIEKIEPKKGEKFDEELHEAVDGEESEDKAGQISELIQAGWRFKEGSVIQHAKVKVFR